MILVVLVLWLMLLAALVRFFRDERRVTVPTVALEGALLFGASVALAIATISVLR